VRDLWNADAVLSELILDRGQSGANEIVDKTGDATIVAREPGEAFTQPDATSGVERRLQVELTPGAAKRFANTRIHARSGYIVPSK
jgi:hypothetical protein